MKFGVREICDVVLKTKSNQKIGNRYFYKNEPVIYFDTLKTSSMEGAATTVYAQGGRGNARLVAWEGERTVTFTMEDALISPLGFMILSGAGLIEASAGEPIQVHTTETTTCSVDGSTVTITLSETPYDHAGGDYIYVMPLKNGEIFTEPYIPIEVDANAKTITLNSADDLNVFNDGDPVFVDYYVSKSSNIQQIEITADKFGGNFYLEASTLFRDTNGVDMPAEFIIPNCKVQSNFTFTMASSGDPSTFTFTMDAFPDYTRFDKTKKVLAAIQIVEDDSVNERVRERTASDGIGMSVDGEAYTDYTRWSPYLTVRFDTQGKGRNPAMITGIESGEKVTAPTNPTASGFTFGGWYKEAACTNQWNFSSDTVTDNITLYAKWTPDE